MATQDPQQTPAQPAPAAPVAAAKAKPWYKNELFWGMVGGAAVSAADKTLHLGMPAAGPAALTVGLGLAWGLHVVLNDWAAHTHSKAVIEADQIVNGIAPAIEAVVAKAIGKVGG